MTDTRREALLQVRRDMQDSGYPTPFQERLWDILDGDEETFLTEEEQDNLSAFLY